MQFQTVTDQLGKSSEVTQDSTGNVTREFDAQGGLTTRSYDANQNVLSETRVIGLEDADPGNSETDDLTTSFTYYAPASQGGVAGGNLVQTQTDPAGNDTLFTYNAAGQVASVADPLGNATRYQYQFDYAGGGWYGERGSFAQSDLLLTTDQASMIRWSIPAAAQLEIND